MVQVGGSYRGFSGFLPLQFLAGPGRRNRLSRQVHHEANDSSQDAQCNSKEGQDSQVHPFGGRRLGIAKTDSAGITELGQRRPEDRDEG